MDPLRIDEKFLEDHNVLSQNDFPSVSANFLGFLNPLRVTSIRKYLVFNAIDYDKYIAIMEGMQPEVFEEKELDLSLVPLVFKSSEFSANYFPGFMDEFFTPLSFLKSKADEDTVEGKRILETSNYRSLTYSAFEIEKAVKEKYINSGLATLFSEDQPVVFPLFLVPFEQDQEFPVTIFLFVNLFLSN